MSYKRTKVEALIMESFPGQIFFFFFAILHSLWDLSSPTRDQTWALSSESTEF